MLTVLNPEHKNPPPPHNKYGVTAATLTRWREAFLEGNEAELKTRATDIADEERKTLRSARGGFCVLQLVAHMLAGTYLAVGAVAQQSGENERIPNYAESRALLIAVSTYDNKENYPSLPLTKDDVRKVQKILISQGFIVEPPLIDPTLVEMRNAMQKFFMNARDFDRLLLYFTGHGRNLNKIDKYGIQENVLLLPTDAATPTSVSAETSLGQYAVNGKQIVLWAEHSRARHILVVVDACSSGLIHQSVVSRRVSKKFNVNSANNRVRVYLSSGINKQEVPANSIFREEFLKAVTTQDKNWDKRITDYEMYMYLFDAVNSRSGTEPKISTTSEQTRFVFFPN